MTPDRLLALFDRISDAPDAFARLRNFVLDLAMRGKLEVQDHNDEPASELLKRIASKKALLIKAGAIKVRKIISRDRSEPLNFVCPLGWELADLGTIAEKITDGAHKTPTYVDQGIPFVSIKDFSGGSLVLTCHIPEGSLAVSRTALV